MNVRASAKFIRMSPKKVRLLVNLIRNLDVSDALAQLEFTVKTASTPVLKLINSAVANAVHNNNLDKNNLYIKEARVDMGPVLKRWSPKAFGRAALIRKRMSHIHIVLGERVPTVEKDRTKQSVVPQGRNTNEKRDTEENIGEQMSPPKPSEVVRHPQGEAPVGGELPEIFDVRKLGKRRLGQNRDKKQLATGAGKGLKFINKLFNRRSGEK